jgi:hypothetical protein
MVHLDTDTLCVLPFCDDTRISTPLRYYGEYYASYYSDYYSDMYVRNIFLERPSLAL